jgi:hypothetical protein
MSTGTVYETISYRTLTTIASLLFSPNCSPAPTVQPFPKIGTSLLIELNIQKRGTECQVMGTTTYWLVSPSRMQSLTSKKPLKWAGDKQGCEPLFLAMTGSVPVAGP